MLPRQKRPGVENASITGSVPAATEPHHRAISFLNLLLIGIAFINNSFVTVPGRVRGLAQSSGCRDFERTAYECVDYGQPLRFGKAGDIDSAGRTAIGQIEMSEAGIVADFGAEQESDSQPGQHGIAQCFAPGHFEHFGRCGSMALHRPIDHGARHRVLALHDDGVLGNFPPANISAADQVVIGRDNGREVLFFEQLAGDAGNGIVVEGQNCGIDAAGVEIVDQRP